MLWTEKLAEEIKPVLRRKVTLMSQKICFFLRFLDPTDYHDSDAAIEMKVCSTESSWMKVKILIESSMGESINVFVEKLEVQYRFQSLLKLFFGVFGISRFCWKD